ncbi:hypothetical protein GOP47_0014613 [Adiantum capillus-veneris]|uniref:Uncharacterized protein n=1 Tax=Adiantum capillus-veneris TaxID=13818 RepID=A0A9D4ZEC6_ADICA|nr:hypothetical protein GOP47_0014613 [Adiantum capillus-veneris]
MSNSDADFICSPSSSRCYRRLRTSKTIALLAYYFVMRTRAIPVVGYKGPRGHQIFCYMYGNHGLVPWAASFCTKLD